ncbi:MAG: hypothetical protein WCD53_18025 [Microcoleus sp.]
MTIVFVLSLFECRLGAIAKSSRSMLRIYESRRLTGVMQAAA